MIEHVAQRLDLSDEQRDQIRDILLSHKDELQAELQAVRDARSAQFDAIHADTFNEAAIRAAAAEVGTAEAELAVTRGVIVSEVRQVLTPEQQAEAAKLRQDARSFVDSLVEMIRARFELMG